MSSFTTPLRVEVGDSGRVFRVLEEFRYYLYEPEGEDVRVPVGFLTDFATIPFFMWIVLPPSGPYSKASVIHDYLYQYKGLGKYSRKEVDKIFLKGMMILNRSRTQSWIMYFCVRVFGWMFWGRNSLKF